MTSKPSMPITNNMVTVTQVPQNPERQQRVVMVVPFSQMGKLRLKERSHGSRVIAPGSKPELDLGSPKSPKHTFHQPQSPKPQCPESTWTRCLDRLVPSTKAHAWFEFSTKSAKRINIMASFERARKTTNILPKKNICVAMYISRGHRPWLGALTYTFRDLSRAELTTLSRDDLAQPIGQ